MADSSQVTRVVIDVPDSEFWRICCIPCICCLPPPKAIRVKNEMARKGWSFEGQSASSTFTGYTSLIFWKYVTN